MKITVEMTSEEFQEFMAWKKDEKMYDQEMEKVFGNLEFMARRVLLSVEPDPEKLDEYKIVEQGYMADLYDAASEILA